MAKYYNIAEVSSMVGTSKSNLRYLETTIKKFSIKKIRGRRYYTDLNIEQIQTKLQEKGFELPQMELFTHKSNSEINNEMLQKIDDLEQKFKDLQNKLKVA